MIKLRMIILLTKKDADDNDKCNISATHAICISAAAAASNHLPCGINIDVVRDVPAIAARAPRPVVSSCIA